LDLRALAPSFAPLGLTQTVGRVLHLVVPALVRTRAVASHIWVVLRVRVPARLEVIAQVLTAQVGRLNVGAVVTQGGALV